MIKTIFEKSQKNQKAFSLPKSEDAFDVYQPPKEYLRDDQLALPEVSEIDLTRHYSGLAHRNMGIDTHFYPLGSCTMKLNPRVNEWAAALPGFTRTHPLAPDSLVQGNLQVIEETLSFLSDLCGMECGSLNPNAGAQGEFVGIKMIAAYHREKGQTDRNELLIPDSAHGTNPATAAAAGFKIVSIPTDEKGDIDLEKLKSACSEKTAGLMLTNPNTLGLFSPVIMQIAEIVHAAGGLLYYDGANLNPMMGIVRPGDMGFDVMHINLHKTFSTPHGGGGPGSGPVLCKKRLEPYLPVPRVKKEEERYCVEWSNETSIGQISSFYGNFAIYLRAYLYIKLHGVYGLRKIAEMAVLNANYLKAKLGDLFTVPYPQPCMHEFVIQADNYLDKGVRALDIAKRLLDYGCHAPTIYFPLIVKECMLIEPTESESLATLDRFVEILEKIVEEIHSDPDLVKNAPYSLPSTRLDEVKAAKEPILNAL
ncbi:putative glycine dehydrogenase [decarboxylating] subunit 2 [Waddlia chondrophila 2032/99]|uniref:glycine dehydrogenase (aminomethyl-transferring) n=1 Tax=Waddlia chondrophila 2032/99 TaxID=765953 RepID=F8LAV0_9BACT|nr:putative glycine dehydrogenase [decarboxylating] subunit 2 [Waddlia chondrophila 2032/99]